MPPATWRTVLLTIAISAGIVVAAGAVYLYGGFFDVAATDRHWPATAWLLQTARMRSIRMHAGDIRVPPDIDDPAKLAIGTEHFATHCVVCHGAPGVPKDDLALGMYPRPPYLPQVAGRYSDGELFWIIKHGIKMSGMPAWADHSDDEIWATVAFLRKLGAGMSEADYARLVQANVMHGMQHHHDEAAPAAAAPAAPPRH